VDDLHQADDTLSRYVLDEIVHDQHVDAVVIQRRQEVEQVRLCDRIAILAALPHVL
jgi:hypothetical protein